MPQIVDAQHQLLARPRPTEPQTHAKSVGLGRRLQAVLAARHYRQLASASRHMLLRHLLTNQQLVCMYSIRSIWDQRAAREHRRENAYVCCNCPKSVNLEHSKLYGHVAHFEFRHNAQLLAFPSYILYRHFALTHDSQFLMPLFQIALMSSMLFALFTVNSIPKSYIPA